MIDGPYLIGFAVGLFIAYKILRFIIKKIRRSPTTETDQS